MVLLNVLQTRDRLIQLERSLVRSNQHIVRLMRHVGYRARMEDFVEAIDHMFSEGE